MANYNNTPPLPEYTIELRVTRRTQAYASSSGANQVASTDTIVEIAVTDKDLNQATNRVIAAANELIPDIRVVS